MQVHATSAGKLEQPAGSSSSADSATIQAMFGDMFAEHAEAGEEPAADAAPAEPLQAGRPSALASWQTAYTSAGIVARAHLARSHQGWSRCLHDVANEALFVFWMLTSSLMLSSACLECQAVIVSVQCGLAIALCWPCQWPGSDGLVKMISMSQKLAANARGVAVRMLLDENGIVALV